MKSTSHFAMAHLVYANLQKRGVNLNRIAFVYGNIAPDYVPTMVVTPHFTKVCSRNIEDLSATLSQRPLDDLGRINADYSKHLGIMCHYICDYFCFAHSKDFAGSLKQHSVYENSLDSFLRKNCMTLFDSVESEPSPLCADSSVLLKKLDERKSEYSSVGYSFANDLIYAFNMCVDMILSITGLSLTQFTLNAIQEPFEIPSALKGFATGNCYVFRMFFFKNRNSNIFFIPELMPPIMV